MDVSEQIRSELEGFAAEERKNVSVLCAPAVNDQCWETRAETWLGVFDLLLKETCSNPAQGDACTLYSIRKPLKLYTFIVPQFIF